MDDSQPQAARGSGLTCHLLATPGACCLPAVHLPGPERCHENSPRFPHVRRREHLYPSHTDTWFCYERRHESRLVGVVCPVPKSVRPVETGTHGDHRALLHGTRQDAARKTPEALSLQADRPGDSGSTAGPRRPAEPCSQPEPAASCSYRQGVPLLVTSAVSQPADHQPPSPGV